MARARSIRIGTYAARAAALATVVLPCTADASEPERTDAIEWTAPRECPDGDWVTETVARWVARDLATAPQRPITATGTIVRQSSGEYTLSLRIDAGQGAVDARTLHDPDCRVLAQAAALVVAVALDPDAAARAMSVAPPPVPPPDAKPPPAVVKPIPEPSPVPQPGPPPTPAAPATAPVAAPSPSDATTRAKRCRAARPGSDAPRDPTAACVSFGARGALQAGVLPRAIEPGVQGEIAVFWSRLRIELGASHWFPRTRTEAGEARARLSLSAGHLAACWRAGVGPVEIPVCGGLEVGALRGEGRNVTDPKDDTLVWSAAMAGPRLHWPFVRRAALTVQLDLVVPLAPYTFEIGGEPVHRVAPVAGRGGLGLELRLP